MRKAILLSLLALCCVAVPAMAGTYPEKPIQLIVPYKPGGGSDVSARIVCDHLKKYLPQPVIVTNINGAAGGLGAMAAMKANPDGYTVFWEHPTLTMVPLATKTEYTWKSFDPVCMAATSPTCLIVPKNSPFKTAKEAFAAIKAAPGKYRYPMALGGVSQFTYLYIKDATGIDPLVIPTTGDKNRVLSLMGGNGDITTVTFSSALPYVKSGDLRVLGMVSNERSPQAPDVPTLKELGIDAAYDFRYTVFVPKGTPKDVIATLNAAFKKVMADPDNVKMLGEQSIAPFYRDTPETIKVWEKEDELNHKVAQKHGLMAK